MFIAHRTLIYIDFKTLLVKVYVKAPWVYGLMGLWTFFESLYVNIIGKYIFLFMRLVADLRTNI